MLGALFLAGAGLNIMNSLQQNKVIESTSNANYSSAVARAERDAVAQRSQLLGQARQQSLQVNQERYNLQLEAMRERASGSVNTAERGFGGVLAKRLQTATDISEAQESATLDINEESQLESTQASSFNIEQTKVDRFGNARLARHNALAQRTTGLGLVTGAVSGGAQGVALGKSLQG
jgi:hypothetical protein